MSHKELLLCTKTVFFLLVTLEVSLFGCNYQSVLMICMKVTYNVPRAIYNQIIQNFVFCPQDARAFLP